MVRTCTLTHGWEGDQLPCLRESVWVRQSFRRHPAGLGDRGEGVEAHWELLMNSVAARGQHSWRG
jgi:hypothetical protein